ncbi:hypothetical protein [Bacteroides fragilis]|uniref:hypothetical protein n=1 Tax=Bacteroides fragilis TaxID=817 RepID=UPI0021BCFFFF
MEKDIQRINVYTAIEQMKRLSQEGETFSLSFRKYDRQRHSGGDTVRLNHARLRPKASDEEIENASYKLFLVVSAFLHFPPFATLCKPTTCEILFRETNPKRDKNGTKSQENKIKNASSPTSLVVDFSFLCKGTILSREKQAKSSKYAAYQTFILHVHFQEDTASASCTDLCCLLQRPVKIRFMPFVHYGIAADAHCLGTVYNPSAIICNAEICVPSANW